MRLAHRRLPPHLRAELARRMHRGGVMCLAATPLLLLASLLAEPRGSDPAGLRNLAVTMSWLCLIGATATVLAACVFFAVSRWIAPDPRTTAVDDPTAGDGR